jgi:hypothetical protein
MKALIVLFCLVSMILLVGCSSSNSVSYYNNNSRVNIYIYTKMVEIRLWSIDGDVGSSWQHYLDIITMCEDGIVCYKKPSSYESMSCFRYIDLAQKYCNLSYLNQTYGEKE